MITKTARVSLAVAAAATLVLSACSSSGGDSKTSGPSGSTSSAGKAATGTPLHIGYYNQVNSTTLNFPEYTIGTKAAVDYINNQLGGVNGHPIVLDSCETAGTPESTQKCAQQLVAKKPIVVVAGADFNQAAANPIFVSAGVSQIGGSPLQPPDYTAKNAFYFVSGTPGILASEADLAIKLLHAKSVGIIYDNASTKAGLNFITDPLDKAGVKHTAVDASASNDYTGPFSALNASKQDAIITVLGSSSGCTGFAQARKAQQNTTPVIAISPCRAPDVVKAVGADEDGWYTTSGFEDVTNNPSPDMKILINAVNKYGKTKPQGLMVPAFQAMMTVYSVLKGVGVNGTAANVTTYMQTKSGQIFGGPTWKCGKLTKFPSLCSAESLFYQVKGDSVIVANGGKYFDATSELGG